MIRRRLIAPLLGLLLTACGPDMEEQERPDPMAPEQALDGPTSRLPVAGTVARGEQTEARILQDRPALSAALLERGRERYDIYCVPCHGAAGYGDGLVVARGFPAPPSFHQERLREAPDGHILAVIGNGFGAMFPYGDRVPPADRWAIVAYIRALQLSQHAEADALPETVREALP